MRDTTIYDWIFCYKNGLYHLYKVDDLNFPFKINEKIITIENRRFIEKMVDLANRILEKWNLEAIIREYARHIKNQSDGDLPKDLKKILKETGLFGKKDPYVSFWYTLWKIFEEATRPMYNTKGRLGKILGKIYSFFYKPKYPYIHENIENALEMLFCNKHYNLKQKFALGFALIFGLYRVYRLLERGIMIRYLP